MYTHFGFQNSHLLDHGTQDFVGLPSPGEFNNICFKILENLYELCTQAWVNFDIIIQEDFASDHASKNIPLYFLSQFAVANTF